MIFMGLLENFDYKKKIKGGKVSPTALLDNMLGVDKKDKMAKKMKKIKVKYI